MNRHERRKAAAKARRGGPTVQQTAASRALAGFAERVLAHDERLLLSHPTRPRCPYCAVQFDRSARVGEGRGGTVTHAGDLTVCVYCAGVSAFAADGTLSPRTDEQVLAALGPEHGLIMLEARDILRGTIARMRAERMGQRPSGGEA